MTAPRTPDRELFQKFLADIFEVQQSGVASESLAATLELHRLITSGKISADEAIRMVAENAQRVANAGGVIIGTLRGDQLIYRACIGNASSSVEQRGMATVCIAPNASAAEGEILRVENSETDLRIESAVCRQFGARALLILPIYHERRVAGVLGVLFDTPHAFEPAEVRSYRLMASLVDEAVSQALPPAAEKNEAAGIQSEPQLDAAPGPTEIFEPEEAGELEAPEVIAQYMNERIPEDVLAKVAVPIPVPRREIARERTSLPIFKLVRRAPLPRGNWRGVAAIVAFFVMVTWIALGHRQPDRPLEAASDQGRPVPGQRLPFAGPKQDGMATPVTLDSRTVTGLHPSMVSTASVVSSDMEAGSEDFDYADTAANVQVRRAALRRRLMGIPTRVLRKSDDVTVRYFDPPAKPLTTSSSSDNDKVRYISDDVTVRYFQKPASSPERSRVEAP